MRVLHVLNELRPSGVETMLRVAASDWRAQGITGEILCTGEQSGVYAVTLTEAGYIIHHLPFARSIGFLIEVSAFFWRNRFDTVHIHTERASFWYAALAFFTGRRRILRSINSVFPFRGALRLRRFVQRLLMRCVFGVRMTACSESVRRQEWLSYRNASPVIPNWFDNTYYRPARGEERAIARESFAIDPDALVVCSVGNCSPVKNHVAVLRAIGELAERVKVVYLHVGDERDGDTERELAVELGIAAQVRFLGPQLAFRSILHASDVFAMPSLHEGFGVAALEAMAAGVPAALADVEGLRDFRDIDPSIYWLEPTPTGVEAALLHFHEMGARARQSAGERLSARVHQRFAMTVGAAQYAALYRGEATLPIASTVTA